MREAQTADGKRTRVPEELAEDRWAAGQFQMVAAVRREPGQYAKMPLRIAAARSMEHHFADTGTRTPLARSTQCPQTALGSSLRNSAHRQAYDIRRVCVSSCRNPVRSVYC